MMDPAAVVEEPRTASEPETSPVSRSRVLLLSLLALLLAFLPNLVLHLLDLGRRPYYEFLPLVPLGALVLAWGPCRALGAWSVFERGRGQVGRGAGVLLGLAGLLLAFASLIDSTWLGMVGLLTALMALAIDLGGKPLARATLPAWAFLWITIPLPAELDQPLISRLQRLTTALSGPVLDAIGLRFATEGFIINVEGHRLLVEEACSGIGSLFIVLATAWFYALWSRFGAIRTAALLALVPFFTLLGNVARVVTVALAETRLGLDVGHGWRHEALGLLACLLALGLVFSGDQLLLFLAAAVRFRWRRPVPWVATSATPGAAPESASAVVAPVVVGSRRRLESAWVLAGFSALALGQWVWLWPLLADGRLMGLGRDARFTPAVRALQADALPPRWHQFERTGFEAFRRGHQSEFGDYSRLWTYHDGRHLARVCLDEPFLGWHELTSCYKNLGWALQSRRVIELAGPTRVVEARFRRASGGQALLYFTCMNESSKGIEPVEPNPAVAIREGDLMRWLRSRLAVSMRNRTETHGSTFQVQLLLEAESPIVGVEQTEAQTFFEQALGLIRQRVAAELEKEKRS